MNPKVSVIIPVYNVEKYLRQCLDSVINQTLKDIEVICIDDGSTDSSLDILEEYLKSDDRIKLLLQENKHAGVARNKGLEIATGEFVHFLDSDDWIELDTYEKLYNLAKEKNADLIKFRAYSYDNETGEISSSAYLDIGYVAQEYMENYINVEDDTNDIFKLPDSPCLGFYNLKFLQDNHICFDDFLCANDVGFFYRCVLNAKKVYLSSFKLLYYRRNLPKSLISRRAENFNCQTALYNIVKKEVKTKSEKIQYAAINKIIAATFVWYNRCINEYKLTRATEEKIKKEMMDFLFKISREDLSEENRKKYGKILTRIKKEKIRRITDILQKVFSVKNVEKHKVVCIFGLKIKFKNPKLDKSKQ